MAGFYTQILEKAGEMAPSPGVLREKKNCRDYFDCERSLRQTANNASLVRSNGDQEGLK
jgi:hypothetical protein